MITLSVSNFNHISQKIYDKIVLELQLHQLTCPSCGHSACLRVHGYYERGVRTSDGLIRLRILRVKCSCGKTHAILLSSMVPYSGISLEDQVLIASCQHLSDTTRFLQLKRPNLSEWTIRYIWNAFHRIWKQRLLAESIPLSPIPELVCRCFSSYHRQFLQIHRGINTLFLQTT